MFRFIFFIAVIFICTCWCIYCIKLEKNKKKLLTSSRNLPLETVVSFSLVELTSRLKRYYRKEGKTILIEYADDKWVAINTNDTQLMMLKVLDEAQDFMISKRYNPDEEYAVREYINSIMHDIWLDYAYKSNYKALFWGEMNYKYASGEVSTSSYNEVYRRFYKYKHLENK